MLRQQREDQCVITSDAAGGIAGHRDVKPGNIFQAEDGSFALLDLGIAKVLSLDPLTATEAVSPRTNRYAGPEQFASRGLVSIGARTDLFGAGIVLFETATRSHPFFEG